jgi:hypothetical protein
LVGVIGFIAAMLAILTNWQTGTTVLRSALFYKQDMLTKVEGLRPGVTIGVYQDTFGRPTLVRHLLGNAGQHLPGKEYVFLSQFFYLDVATDTDDMVTSFAITTRERDFNPVFSGPDFDITLGASRFSDIPGLPDYIGGCIGPYWLDYYEARGYGSQSDQQGFAFGDNATGYSGGDSSLLGFLRAYSDACGGVQQQSELSQITQSGLFVGMAVSTVINTYAISIGGPQTFQQYDPNWLGVHIDQVRTLGP